MSGIVGIFNRDGSPVEHELLKELTGYLSDRGPDAQNFWIDRNIGLGHTTFQTTFEAATETQPQTIDGQRWLVADARIDGRAELLHKLQRKLAHTLQFPSSASNLPPLNDAKLILLAYEAWEEDCVKHLIGDFSFALWDGHQRRLFCARDHFGVKPFYYARIGRSFLFSNTLNCLRQHPNISQSLNEVAIGDYLLFGLNQDLTTTSFSDIQRLPPATALTISSTTDKTRKFWALPECKQIRFQRAADYVEKFDELFSQAVADRLRTNAVSISMSGGLDSTSVAAVAGALLRPNFGENAVRGCVVVYDTLIPDEERRFSTLAAEALKIPLTQLPADSYSLYEEGQPDDLNSPEPFLVNPTAAQFNQLLRSMAEHSRIALTGWDGDALMNEPSHATFAAAASEFRIKDLVNYAGWFLSRGQLPPIGIRTRLKRLVDANEPVYPEWINDSFARRVKLKERWREFTSEPSITHRTRPYALRVLRSKRWMPLFEGYDAGTHRLPLEVRHPMLDIRLVEFLLGIPAIPWCVDKEILRISMKGKLLEAIRTRPKTPLTGFPALRLVEKSSVRFVDNFKPSPGLSEFVNLSCEFKAAGEKNYDKLWMNLRPFGLNHWLVHSLPIRSNTKVHKSETSDRFSADSSVAVSAGSR
jgi:asparagine synthase (glutamine-hydrolysing)